MAALTRSGARKASEIVMLILRMLQFSRWAMLSVVTDGSFVSSSSQLRPRAIAKYTFDALLVFDPLAVVLYFLAYPDRFNAFLNWIFGHR